MGLCHNDTKWKLKLLNGSFVLIFLLEHWLSQSQIILDSIEIVLTQPPHGRGSLVIVKINTWHTKFKLLLHSRHLSHLHCSSSKLSQPAAVDHLFPAIVLPPEETQHQEAFLGLCCTRPQSGPGWTKTCGMFHSVSRCWLRFQEYFQGFRFAQFPDTSLHEEQRLTKMSK